MNKLAHRHGDVGLIKIAKLPNGAEKLKDKVLAYGEVTGHSHRFEHPERIERYSFDKKLYLQVIQRDRIIHEEHLPQVILPGIYEQIQEREHDYIEESARAVVD